MFSEASSGSLFSGFASAVPSGIVETPDQVDVLAEAQQLVEAPDRIERVERTAEGKSRVVLRDGSHVDAKELIISRRHVAEVKRRLKES